MGIYDRDYMREQDPADWWKPRYSIKRWLAIGIIAISLLISLVFLARNMGLTKRTTSRTVVTQRSEAIERYAKGSRRVNINSATVAELETLPGIGPAKARLIAANRPYQSIDDLAKLQGIGAKLANNLHPFVKTDGDTEKLKAR